MINRTISTRKRVALVSFGAVLIFGGATSLVTAYANTGGVSGTVDCTNWSVNASLDSNVVNRLVTVTWPDATNVINAVYTTTSGAVPHLFSANGSWPVSGPPFTGTIVETIYNADTLGSGVAVAYTKSIARPNTCPPFTVPSLALTKTADAASVNAGSAIGFTITLSNTGTGDATGATLTDTLPSGSGITWSIATQTGPATCGISGTPQKLDCGTFTLAAAGSEVVHVTSPTTAASCGTYDNKADFTSTNGGSGSSSKASTTVKCATLTITKTADAASVAAGGTIGFVITLSNAGPGDSTGTTLTDTLPGGAGVTWSILTQTGPATCSIAGTAPQTLGCGSFTLASGASETVHVTSSTTTASCGIYNNTASFTTGNDGTGSANGTTTVTTCGPPAAPVCTPAKTSDPTGSVPIGAVITYTVSVTNTGTAPTTVATPCIIGDTLSGDSPATDVALVQGPTPPAGTTMTILNGPCSPTACTELPISITWTVPNLGIGATESFTMKIKVISAGSILDSATGTSSLTGLLTNKATSTTLCTTNCIVIVNNPIATTLTKTVSPTGTVPVGTVLTYTITLTNTSAFDINPTSVPAGITVDDVLTGTAGTVVNTSSFSGSPTVAINQLSPTHFQWKYATLAAGASGVVTFKATIVKTAGITTSCLLSTANSTSICLDNTASTPGEPPITVENISPSTPASGVLGISTTVPGTGAIDDARLAVASFLFLGGLTLMLLGLLAKTPAPARRRAHS